MESENENQRPFGSGCHLRPIYHHGTGPFDVLRWYRNAGWNACILKRKRRSPVILKLSAEHKAWCEGYDARLAYEAREAKFASRTFQMTGASDE